MCPNWVLGSNLHSDMCPLPGIEPTVLWCVGCCTEPRWPGPHRNILKGNGYFFSLDAGEDMLERETYYTEQLFWNSLPWPCCTSKIEGVCVCLYLCLYIYTSYIPYTMAFYMSTACNSSTVCHYFNENYLSLVCKTEHLYVFKMYKKHCITWTRPFVPKFCIYFSSLNIDLF